MGRNYRPVLLADVGDGMIITMRRGRTQQATPDLFSTDMVPDAFPPPTKQLSPASAVPRPTPGSREGGHA